MMWLFCDRIATKIDKNNGISMITHNFNTLDLLTSPVWIVSPFEEQLIYANSAARLLMQELTFSQLRTGNDSNLLIVFYVQIMPDDFVMQLHRF
ncbi:hypothetical protein CR539_11455 [Escherichia coli]|nr:hypothetical protein CR539_11455 [Escherichia coli]